MYKKNITILEEETRNSDVVYNTGPLSHGAALTAGGFYNSRDRTNT